MIKCPALFKVITRLLVLYLLMLTTGFANPKSPALNSDSLNATAPSPPSILHSSPPNRNTNDASFIVHYKAYVHGEPLVLNKKYLNPFGESFEISRFKFYTGKFSPLYENKNQEFTVTKDYHLIDFSDTASTYVELTAAGGLCKGIRFQLGIDSADQDQGAQTGALDPVKGMFWTWNSGYQTFKIEGRSSLSDQPAHMIAYHIGGYREPYNTVWKLEFMTTNEQVFRISNENKIIIEIGIDLDYLFDAGKPLHIKETATCTTPGKLARDIAENFIGTFTGLTISSKP